jgi:hypothetical protein
VSVSSEVQGQPEQAARPALPPALVALIAPDLGMERQARVGGVKLSLLIAMACAIFAGGALAMRVNASGVTLQKLEKAGTLATMSERQIEDETRNAERLFTVTKVGGALFEAPVGLGLAALATVLLGWFLKGRIKGSTVLPVAAATLLPGAIANLLNGISTLRAAYVTPEHVALVPTNLSEIAASLGHPLIEWGAKLGGAFDLFSLWSALLLGYGVAAAASIPARRAITGTLVAWVCWRLLTHVAVGG